MLDNAVRTHLSRFLRAHLLLTLPFVAACSPGVTRPPVREIELRFVGDYNIPTRTPLSRVEPPEFGGISSIHYDEATEKLLALSDARSDYRYYTLEIDLGGDSIDFRPVGVTFLESGDQDAMELHYLDPEGIASSPDGALFIASEGFADSGVEPGLFMFGREGRLIQEIPIPEKFLPVEEEATARGVRHNKAFESLTLSPDGARLFLATEAALIQDGIPTSPELPSRSRIIAYSVEGDDLRPAHEYAYDVDPVGKPGDFGPGVGANGLVELLALDRKTLLALERSFFVEESGSPTPRSYQRIRIYRVSLEGATDVVDVPSLLDAPEVRPAGKALVLDLEDIVDRLDPKFPLLDNFEGMCFGPRLPNGGRTLILVSDNNFRDNQRTAFLVFELIETDVES
jgi:hypothetical protein